MKVSLFVTCLVDQFFPNVAESMAHLLHRKGVRVDFPAAQTCCGQPAFNSGFVEPARRVARNMIEAFESAEYVVTPSGSCAGMVRHYYHDLFPDDPQMAERGDRLAAKTYEFSQFVVNILKSPDFDAVFPHRVTYHPSCHGIRLLGVREEPMQLLSQVRDIELVPLPYAQDCCGFGGTFAVKMADISAAMVEEKARHVLETDAEVLVSTDMGCLMNIGGYLNKHGKPVRILHLAQLLYEGSAHHGAGKQRASQTA